MVNKKLQSCIDLLAIETIVSNVNIKKNAQSGIVTSLMQTIFDWAHDKFILFKNNNQKVEMIFNFLVPGILGGFGFPVIGFLAELAKDFFHIEYANILKSIIASFKNVISGGKKLSSDEVISTVHEIFTSNLPPDPTEEDMPAIIKENKYVSLREANLFKIALNDFIFKNPDINIEKPKINIKFAAGLFASALASFVASKGKTVKILISITGWIFKTVLYACGFMAASDAIGSLLGHSNSDKDTSDPIKQEQKKSPIEVKVNIGPKQNVFKVSPNYSEEYFNGPATTWTIQGNINSIESIIINWANEIYPTSKTYEDLMLSSNTFINLINAIKSYNEGSPPNIIFMPRQLKSRKQTVDLFMGEVALNTKLTPLPNTKLPIKNLVSPPL